jgi:hypothetical protein
MSATPVSNKSSVVRNASAADTAAWYQSPDSRDFHLRLSPEL